MSQNIEVTYEGRLFGEFDALKVPRWFEFATRIHSLKQRLVARFISFKINDLKARIQTKDSIKWDLRLCQNWLNAPVSGYVQNFRLERY